jgi:exopolysaccharide production protein ExoQ
MSYPTVRYTQRNTWENSSPWEQGEPICESNASPVYKYLNFWLLLLPILYIAANGQLSITNAATNSGDMTQNGYLLRTAQGIRPQIILYYLFMAGYAFVGHKAILRVALQNWLLLLAPAYAALSAIWSVSPGLTLRGAYEVAMTTWFAFYLSERYSTERLMRILVLAGSVAAFLSLVLVAFFPAYGVYHRDGSGAWQGICSHKNFLGVSMAFLLTPIFFTPGKFFRKVPYVATLSFLVFMSQSRGAWFITAGMFLFVGWVRLSRRLRNRENLLVSVTTVVIVVGLVALGIIYIDPLMRSIGKDPTMTGRTDIYIAVLKSIMKHPALGYGFGGFWFGLNPESNNIGLEVHWMSIGYAENGILEMWLELGAVGLFLIFMPIVRAIRQSARLLSARYYNPRVGWFATILFLEIVSNIEAGAVLTPVTLNWTLTIIAVVGLAKEFRNREPSGSIFTMNTQPAARYMPASSI